LNTITTVEETSIWAGPKNGEQPRSQQGACAPGLSGTPQQYLGPSLQNPLLRSGLALAGVNTWVHQGQLLEEAEDGVLTAEDVSGLDLLDTELGVLSACETGLGQIHTGEGVFGLQRAFILAGAKALLMSLWAVPDETTRLLMEEFYERILSGQPRAEALRLSQQAVRANHPDPLHWGAFVCLGDPGPLST
jgi:CHAT domain-containing protein